MLIIATLIMIRQLNFVRDSKTLGFNDENVVVLNTNMLPEYRDLRNILKENYLQHDHIIDVTTMRYLRSYWESAATVPLRNGKDLKIRKFYVDYDFLKTLQMDLISGRDFSKQQDW